MAEQFLTLMADLDEESQKIMGQWYDRLKDAGFSGVQTPGLPFHISMGTFDLEKEAEVVENMKRIAEEFGPVQVNISHMGIFAGGKVLFGAPDMNPPSLISLREAITVETKEEFPWSPHATILLDEPEIICRAMPELFKMFKPFLGYVTRLHLCAFWPTREILSVFTQSKKWLQY